MSFPMQNPWFNGLPPPPPPPLPVITHGPGGQVMYNTPSQPIPIPQRAPQPTYPANTYYPPNPNPWLYPPPGGGPPPPGPFVPPWVRYQQANPGVVAPAPVQAPGQAPQGFVPMSGVIPGTQFSQSFTAAPPPGSYQPPPGSYFWLRGGGDDDRHNMNGVHILDEEDDESFDVCPCDDCTRRRWLRPSTREPALDRSHRRRPDLEPQNQQAENSHREAELPFEPSERIVSFNNLTLTQRRGSEALNEWTAQPGRSNTSTDLTEAPQSFHRTSNIRIQFDDAGPVFTDLSGEGDLDLPSQEDERANEVEQSTARSNRRTASGKRRNRASGLRGGGPANHQHPSCEDASEADLPQAPSSQKASSLPVPPPDPATANLRILNVSIDYSLKLLNPNPFRTGDQTPYHLRVHHNTINPRILDDHRIPYHVDPHTEKHSIITQSLSAGRILQLACQTRGGCVPQFATASDSAQPLRQKNLYWLDGDGPDTAETIFEVQDSVQNVKQQPSGETKRADSQLRGGNLSPEDDRSRRSESLSPLSLPIQPVQQPNDAPTRRSTNRAPRRHHVHHSTPELLEPHHHPLSTDGQPSRTDWASITPHRRGAVVSAESPPRGRSIHREPVRRSQDPNLRSGRSPNLFRREDGQPESSHYRRQGDSRGDRSLGRRSVEEQAPFPTRSSGQQAVLYDLVHDVDIPVGGHLEVIREGEHNWRRRVFDVWGADVDTAMEVPPMSAQILFDEYGGLQARGQQERSSRNPGLEQNDVGGSRYGVETDTIRSAHRDFAARLTSDVSRGRICTYWVAGEEGVSER